MNIAIDGPAGAGKSTIAKAVAKELGYIYVDTGAMYRAIALYILENNIDVDNEQSISQACGEIDVQIQYEDGMQQVYLNGRNVQSEIRKEAVGNMASTAAAKKPVRDKLLLLQRNIAGKQDVVMDGRDIGTFVLPNAEYKFYLTASVKTRAMRRYKELTEKGETPDIAKIEADIEKRDYQDMNREIAPLKQAEDAIYIDSSDMTIGQVVSLMCDKVK
ncbi:MAG: (d)CMP kinase [Clostridium sp.]|nr:(d)CMP kinase [Clostridium sp.]MCM1400164.1 (d)CMP kinase [Clostridium sp.]MCM1460896.1 (d)CMP kinase [Bacteroides sp.]